MLSEDSYRPYKGKSLMRAVVVGVLYAAITVWVLLTLIVTFKAPEMDWGIQRVPYWVVMAIMIGVLGVLYGFFRVMTTAPRRVRRILHEGGARNIKRIGREDWYATIGGNSVVVRCNHPFWGFEWGFMPPQGIRGRCFRGFGAGFDPRCMLTDGGIAVIAGHIEPPETIDEVFERDVKILAERDFGSWEKPPAVKARIRKSIEEE